MPDTIPNILADRYASSTMVDIWSQEHKIVLERKLWVEILKTQISLGVVIPDGVIQDYESVIDNVDLDSIKARERITRHDVKARVEEFSHLSGHEHIHRGMTSRDITENVEQVQLSRSMTLMYDKMIAVLSRLSSLADQYCDVVLVGRTHNVPAQVTSLGKRCASIGFQVIDGLSRMQELTNRLTLRGIKGPVGTQQDMLDLFDGNAEAVNKLEMHIAHFLGFDNVSTSVGQIYPRSQDLEFIATLVSASAPLGDLAHMVRLMAGQGLASEGSKDGQVGSSAMPHKVNSRTSERINGLISVLRGHLAMVSQLAGNQWLEGDVSCSVVRRVALPDACLAMDGIIESAIEVLDGLEVNENLIGVELSNELPFLATTKILNAAVLTGVGREQAHKIVQEHALHASAEHNPEAKKNSFIEGLSNDQRIVLTKTNIENIIHDAKSSSGLSKQQIEGFIAASGEIIISNPEAAAYMPSMRI